MIYKEEIRYLFDVPDDYYLAHCISADFGMGAGIALEFNKRFNMKNILRSKYPDYLKEFPGGDCILEGRVLNIISKVHCWEKPTYASLTFALVRTRNVCLVNNITKVAMPLIGCGLDRLHWNIVSDLIQEVFGDTDIEVLVCKIDKD